MMLLLLAWSPVAHAEPKDDARRHFVAGLQAAEAKEYERALEEFLAAQNAWPHPSTLYNIARSYADLGNLEEAIRYYRLFQAADPARAPDVEPVVAVLSARLAERSAPPAPAPAPSPTSATAEDVARLAQIAEELRAIQGRLATAPEAPPEAPAPAPVEAPVAPEPALPDNALLADAYERIVVTASRYGQSPLEAPSTVTILSAEDIRQSGASSIPELLRRVAGVDVMELAAGQADVSIRGFNRELSNKVLVLVDGRSVYLDFLGTVLWGNLPLTLESIERIEVIRGPGSAIYGANAVTGVINIITRTPGEGESLATAHLGTDAYIHGAVLADGRKDRTSWRVGAGWDQVARWATTTPDNDTVDLLLDQDELSWRGIHADARVDLAVLDKGLFSASGGYGQGFHEFYALGALGDYGMDFQSAWGRADAAWGPVHLRSFYTWLAGDVGPWYEQVGARSLDTTVDTSTFDVELEAVGDLRTGAVGHRINGGVGYRRKAIEWGYLEGDGAPITEDHASVFIQEEAKLHPVSVVLSLRADRHPLVPIAETLSPRGAIIVQAGARRSLRLTGGSAFRAPAFIESYLDLDVPTGADGVYVEDLGSKELRPERILTGEIGMHDESSAWHQADLALYVNRVTDLIGLIDATPEVLPYDSATNGYEAAVTGFANLPEVYTAVGGEAEGHLFPVDGVDLYANLAIERIFVDEGVDESTSLLKLNAGGTLRTPWRVDLSAHVQYASDQVWALREYDAAGQLTTVEAPVTGRPILSARLAGRPFADDALELAVAGWNLIALAGEGERQHPKGQPVGGRVWGEVTWRF